MENDKEIWIDRLRFVNNADEIITNARDWVNLEKEYENTSNAHMKDISHGFINVSVMGNDYSVKVVVGIDKKGVIHLYDFSDVTPTTIKKEAINNTAAHSKRKVNTVNDFYEESIANDTEESNNKLKQDRNIPKTYKGALAQNEHYRAAIDNLKEQFKITKGHKVGRSGITRLTAKFIAETKTSMDKEDIKTSLDEIFNKSASENLTADELNDPPKMVHCSTKY